jgi:hypothetical protein
MNEELSVPEIGLDAVPELKQRDVISEWESSLEKTREDTRSKLAERLGTYAMIVIAMGLTILVPTTSNDSKAQAERYTYTKDIFTLLITTQVGLFGAVIGFYFGSSSKYKT